MTRRCTTGRLAELFVGIAIATLVVVVAGVATPAHAAAGFGLRETPDKTWMTTGNVYAQAVSEDGKTLYIGGKFKQVREKPVGQGGRVLNVNNVAAIDLATGIPSQVWHPSVTNDDAATEVRALAVKGERVYIGGRFDAVDGMPRRNLAAVDANTGAAVGSFAPTVGDGTSTVYALAADDSRLYAGGKFARVNGTGRGNLAAFDLSSGTLDSGWTARTSQLVRALEFDSGGETIFAAGRFDSVGGSDGATIERQSVARFDTASGNVHPWSIPKGTLPNPMTGWDLTVTPSRLYVAFGLKPNFASAFRLDSGNLGGEVWRFGLVGNPQSLTLSPGGSRLIVGGHFGINPLDQRVCGVKYLKGLVALDPLTGAIDCGWVPSLDQKRRPDYDGAWSLLTTGDQVWVGGGFVGVSGTPQSNLARFTYEPTPLP